MLRDCPKTMQGCIDPLVPLSGAMGARADAGGMPRDRRADEKGHGSV